MPNLPAFYSEIPRNILMATWDRCKMRAPRERANGSRFVDGMCSRLWCLQNVVEPHPMGTLVLLCARPVRFVSKNKVVVPIGTNLGYCCWGGANIEDDEGWTIRFKTRINTCILSLHQMRLQLTGDFGTRQSVSSWRQECLKTAEQKTGRGIWASHPSMCGRILWKGLSERDTIFENQ
jgi:hypothetical protein